MTMMMIPELPPHLYVWQGLQLLSETNQHANLVGERRAVLVANMITKT